jgi:predicted dienelactone hydrolase
VVVGDSQIGSIIGPHLASHGFVFAGVLGQVSWGMTLSPSMVDYPLDQVAALDAIEALTEGPLAGLADTSRTGVIGYSFGSFDALMLTGARIDPAHHASTCAERPSDWSGTWWRYICDPAAWDRVEARATEVGIARGNGLWDPMGDDRIVAAVLGGPEGFDLTGPVGLADAGIPILLLAAGDDEANDYDPATVELFEHYPDAQLITFAGAGHMMIFEPDAQTHILRFATAFFGRQLYGITECGALLTEEFVEEAAPGLGDAVSFDALVWGLLEEG